MTKDEELLLHELTPGPAPTAAALRTSDWFDRSHSDSDTSPVDEFIKNLYGINRLYLQSEARNEYTAILGSLVYLGMVSAAESYFRSLLRRLILFDPACERNASKRTLTYAAAVHHEAKMLPEALLEGISMASRKSVACELKELCGITSMSKEGNVPSHLRLLFENFEAICQVRHCGIHRFGKLGSHQALKLGMGDHSSLLEKPLKLSVTHLQDVAEALESFIRGVNSYCFSDIIKRTHTASPSGRDKPQLYDSSWQLDFSADRERFEGYYKIFASSTPPHKSESVEKVYTAFLAFVKGYDNSRQQPRK